MTFLNFFLLLWVNFALLDPDPNLYSESRCTDTIESGSNWDPDLPTLVVLWWIRIGFDADPWEASGPQKRTLQNYKLLHFLWVIFAHLDADTANPNQCEFMGIWIRIQKTGLYGTLHFFLWSLGDPILVHLLLRIRDRTHLHDFAGSVNMHLKITGPRHIIIRFHRFRQCSGSVTFWYGFGCGSGSSDPYLFD